MNHLEIELQSYKQYFLTHIEIKDYNVVIDGRSLFDQPVKTDLKTHNNNQKLQLVKVMILDFY